MIPTFPLFKVLEFSDKNDIEHYTKNHPPYSDFDFMSLWCWNTKEEVSISIIHDNLVVKFSDYLTGEPFFSYFGMNKTVETCKALLDFSKNNSIEPIIKLLPKVSIKDLDNSIFQVEEDRNHFDYIFSVESLVKYNGSSLKTQRNLLNNFLRNTPNPKIKSLKLKERAVCDEVMALYDTWEGNKGFIIPNESIAIKRFLESVNDFSFLSVGIYIEGKLAAFNLQERTSNEYMNCLFAKGNIKYNGIYAYLMNSTAKVLLEWGYKYINYEQDLGIYNLRKSKQAFDPDHYLKKYVVKYK
ncbi:MAG: phosphatidylglycerol lysyltransferase domain-containing protein [Patescibacteria group bacterium]